MKKPPIVNKIRKAYNKAAIQYGESFYYELYFKHLDVKLLDLFCERVNPEMPICEIGCGPGEISAYLKYKGLNLTGIDISEEMIRIARQLNPHIDFRIGDVFDLQIPDDYFSGVLAPFLFVNYELQEIRKAFLEIHRVLCRDGLFYLSFHAGSERIASNDFLVENNPLEFIFLDVEEIVRILDECGFETIEWIIRSPYKEGESPNKRAYIFARNKK
jgi:ubiquinone/menaquinone biosynthesis C-methylase UbiE